MATETGPTIPSTAEATDGDELGEQIGDEVLPGTVGFPPTDPAGVGPAGSIKDAEHHDSLRQRHRREEPEDRPPPHEVVRLIDPNPSGEADAEPELLAEDVPPVGLASPEEAAMHIEHETGDDIPGD